MWKMTNLGAAKYRCVDYDTQKLYVAKQGALYYEPR